MLNNPLLVGIDFGTTNIKAIVFDPTGRVLAGASAPTPTYYPRPGWAYFDPDEVWKNTTTLLREVTSKVDRDRIVSIGVTSVGESAVPLDANDRPVYPAIAWFDGRTEPQGRWLAEHIGADRLFRSSGLPLESIYSLNKLLWLREHEPDAFARMRVWLYMADYIAYRLSGVAATDYSLASRTLMLDLHQLRWNTELLDDLGMRTDFLPPLLPSGTSLGPVRPAAAAETGLPLTTVIAVGGHDHVCGALAIGVTQSGTMLNSLGTAEAIFLPLKEPLADPQVGVQGYSQGAHVAGGYYVFGGQYTSGACVDWFRNAIGGGADYDTLMAEAAQVPAGSLGVTFLPHLRLANAPYVDPKSRGAFVGLSTDVTRGVLFRAVLEGIALEARNSLTPLLRHVGLSGLNTIYAIGGVTRNKLQMQIRVDFVPDCQHRQCR
ncbi:MAG: carbohydrate kinase [Anaerolineales bacterium]|nr:carbohydrate kinase [Anaerolineales bacterium]